MHTLVDEEMHLRDQKVAMVSLRLGIVELDASLLGCSLKAKCRTGGATLYKTETRTASSDDQPTVDFAFSFKMIYEDTALALEINEVRRVLASKFLCAAMVSADQLLGAALGSGSLPLTLLSGGGASLATVELKVALKSQITLESVGGTRALKIKTLGRMPAMSGKAMTFGTEKEEALEWLQEAKKVRIALTRSHNKVLRLQRDGPVTVVANPVEPDVVTDKSIRVFREPIGIDGALVDAVLIDDPMDNSRERCSPLWCSIPCRQ